LAVLQIKSNAFTLFQIRTATLTPSPFLFLSTL
jgi:hypothetical protein